MAQNTPNTKMPFENRPIKPIPDIVREGWTFGETRNVQHLMYVRILRKGARKPLEAWYGLTDQEAEVIEKDVLDEETRQIAEKANPAPVKRNKAWYAAHPDAERPRKKQPTAEQLQEQIKAAQAALKAIKQAEEAEAGPKQSPQRNHALPQAEAAPTSGK